MILLDTTVLVYATGSEHPLRAPSRWLLAAQRDGRIAATTTVEVLQEFLHVRARRYGRDDAAALTSRFAEAIDLLVTSPDELLAGARLFAQLPRLGPFDSVLAAVAIERHARALVSADRAYDGIADLTWVDLGAPDLELRSVAS